MAGSKWIKRCGAYLTFVYFGAALLQERRLFETQSFGNATTEKSLSLQILNWRMLLNTAINSQY